MLDAGSDRTIVKICSRASTGERLRVDTMLFQKSRWDDRQGLEIGRLIDGETIVRRSKKDDSDYRSARKKL